MRVEGFVGRTPSLRFLGKEGHVCDLRGEKLHEAFVAAALSSAFQRVGLAPRFALLAPADSPPIGYSIYLDASGAAPPPDLATLVDEELAANPQYRLCRQLGQLAAASWPSWRQRRYCGLAASSSSTRVARSGGGAAPLASR